jgi:hypothetical protein
MKHYRLNFIALISCIASAQGELPKLVRAEDSLKIDVLGLHIVMRYGEGITKTKDIETMRAVKLGPAGKK